MQTKIYEAISERECETNDMDMCPYWAFETYFSDYFATKAGAIAKAQSKFAKQPVNKYVHAVHSAVYEIIITEKGIANRKRIYNLFKKQ